VPDLKELLKELQAADIELHELTAQRDAIPAKIAGLEEEIAGLHQRFEETKSALSDARKELKLAELDLASREETIARYNSQLFSAKTNEEYKAFLKEIETAERGKRETEDKIITLMERIEQEEARLTEREAERETEERKKRKEIEEVKASQAELDTHIEKVRDKYNRLRAEVPDDVLVIYDRIKKNKGKVAVAHILEDNRCSACLNPVPAQKAIEVAHSDVLLFCEYCGRILTP